MRDNFPSALSNLREWEGFRDNDRDDPGEETVFGISRHYNPDMAPWPSTWEQAEAFYLKLWIGGRMRRAPVPALTG